MKDPQPAQRPLEGILVLDFSQFLAGPVAALRLADLGARVIKIERPGTGDAGRALAFAGMKIDGDSLSFHAMNRGKESFTADLKSADDLADVRELVKKADVLIENLRPGVMERLGLGYVDVAKLNPRIVYGSVSGYGNEGPWSSRPGQDLLAQSISGLPYQNGSAGDPPIAVGVAIADSITSINMAEGVLAALFARERTGRGAHVETSLLAAMLDLQFELVSAHLTDPSVRVNRGTRNTAHPFLAAPYGVYPTADGNVALAMGSVPELGRLIGLPQLTLYTDPSTWFAEQTAITRLLADHLKTQTTEHWLAILDAADVWCAPVLELPELVQSEGFKALQMTNETRRRRPDGSDAVVMTTRSPLRIDGQPLGSSTAAPRLGEHTESLRREFLGR